MSCGFCRAKNTRNGPTDVSKITTSDWGPLIWQILHCMAERAGRSGNRFIDADQVIDFEFIVLNLGSVIPCKTCQTHYRAYLILHKPMWKGLKDGILRANIVSWLFGVHNHVRSILGQTIDVQTVEQCSELYASCIITDDMIDKMHDILNYAVKLRIIRRDEFTRWMMIFNRLRLALR